MTLVRPEIRRGSDATFKIFLRDVDGRPYDLTGVNYLLLKLPKENIGYVSVDSVPVAALKANATTLVGLVSVLFTAVTGGIIGNDIELVFDGVDSIDDVIDDWNTANPSNQVTTAANQSLIPTARTVNLSQGLDSYIKVYASSPLQLGEVNVTLSEADTTLLKIGKNQAMELTFDKGAAHPAGQRKVILLKESLSVEEKFF